VPSWTSLRHDAPMSTLFDSVPAGDPWEHTAVVGGRFEDDAQLALGFYQLAELGVADWTTRGPNDLLFVPIVYNHRHALELVLKAAVREAAARLRADGATDASLDPATLDDELAGTRPHSLERLANKLEVLLDRLHLEQLPATTRDVLRSLHQLDPHGETFRYSKVKAGKGKFDPARPTQEHIDVVALAEQFRKAFTLLSGGLLTVLDNYREYQAEQAHGASSGI
jgi:hypothetical protein